MRKKIAFLFLGICGIALITEAPAVYAEGEDTTVEQVNDNNNVSAELEVDKTSEDIKNSEENTDETEDTSIFRENEFTITEETKEESKNLLSKVIDTVFPYIKSFLLGLFDFMMDFLNIIISFLKEHFH